MKTRVNLSWLVYGLFALAAALQVLDLATTALAASNQRETNHLINFLAKHVGFAAAVWGMKTLDIAIVGLFFFCWRRDHGIHVKEFVLSLAVLNIAMGFVVANNFATRV